MCRDKTFKKITALSPDVRYRKGKELGRGEQGIVFKAVVQKEHVTIKQIHMDEESKFKNDPLSKQALKHSVFIESAAMKLTNDLVLTKICPHFPLHYCVKYKGTTAVHINEFICNAITFSEWVQYEHSEKTWDSVQFQIVHAIYCMQKYLNMTHLDLHSDNVIIQKVPSQGDWLYTINNEEYYVPNCGYIVYIIDFGHAWIPKKLASWFIRERYRPCRVHHATDLTKLYFSCLNITTAPKVVKRKWRSIIKEMKSNKDNVFQLYFGSFANGTTCTVIDSFGTRAT